MLALVGEGIEVDIELRHEVDQGVDTPSVWKIYSMTITFYSAGCNNRFERFRVRNGSHNHFFYRCAHLI